MHLPHGRSLGGFLDHPLQSPVTPDLSAQEPALTMNSQLESWCHRPQAFQDMRHDTTTSSALTHPPATS